MSSKTLFRLLDEVKIAYDQEERNLESKAEKMVVEELLPHLFSQGFSPENRYGDQLRLYLPESFAELYVTNSRLINKVSSILQEKLKDMLAGKSYKVEIYWMNLRVDIWPVKQIVEPENKIEIHAFLDKAKRHLEKVITDVLYIKDHKTDLRVLQFVDELEILFKKHKNIL